MSATESDLLAQHMPELHQLLRERRVLTIAECAVLTQLSMQTIYRLTPSGELRTCAPGRILGEDLEGYLRRARDKRSQQ